MAEQSRRLVSLDKPIDKFIEDQKYKNTLSKTRRDVSLFLNSKSESRRTRKSCQKSLMNISVKSSIYFIHTEIFASNFAL